MLSGETAVGKYPLKALNTINRIARVTEAYLSERIGTRPRGQAEESLRQTESITRNVAAMVDDLQPKCVAIWSQTGRSALLMSKTHVGVPVFAFTSDRTVHRQMCLDFGVIPFLMDVPKDIRGFIDAVNERLVGEEHVNVGDKIIIICGHPIAQAGAANIIVVHTVTGA
jgi:pyruvate kinase